MNKNFARWTTQLNKFWEKSPKNPWILSILWILLIGWLAFFWNLGNIGLIDETEPLFAEAARQMTVRGDWITPYFNGETRFDKPPLIYWLMAIAYKIIGVNEWAVRLPSAMAAIALTGLGFYVLRYYSAESKEGRGAEESSVSPVGNLGRKAWLAAWMGAAMMALNPITIAWARTGVSDMLLTGCMGGALLCFFVGYTKAGNGEKTPLPMTHDPLPIPINFWYVAFYVLIALAILAKGPVGIVLPGLIIGAFLLYLGNYRAVLREMRLLWGGLIVTAIALPWYVLVTLQNGEAYINSFFGYHNLQRFTGVVNDHWAPWYFYFPVVLIGFAPWSVYLPVAIARLQFWNRKHWQATPRPAQLGLFALFWFAGVFGFFTIAVTKLPSYVLPLTPAAAILVALLWSDLYAEGQKSRSGAPVPAPGAEGFLPVSPSPAPPLSRSLFWSGFFNAVLLSAFAGVIFYSPKIIGYDPAVPKLGKLLQQSGLPVRGAIVWAVTAIVVALLLRRRRDWQWLWSANFVGFLAFIIFVVTPGFSLVDRARQQPLRELSAIAVQQERPGEELIMVGFTKPTVVFYTQQPVTYFPNANQALSYIEQTAVQRPNRPSVLVLGQSNKLRKKFLKRYQYQTLAKSTAYKLLRVFPQHQSSESREPRFLEETRFIPQISRINR